MEVVLAHAKQQGAVFNEDLPLVPSLEDVRRLVSQGPAAPGEPAKIGGQKAKDPACDRPEPGETTYFKGVGKRLQKGTQQASEVYNAIGFFLYTQCKGNPRGEWPQDLCASSRYIL